MLSLKFVDRRLALLALAALALELWVLFSDIHFLWRPPRILPDAAKIAEVLSVKRQGMVRSPLQLNWVSMRAGQELFEGDEVATIGDSEATLRFADGRTLTLGSNSLLLLRSARLLNQRSFQLTLMQGSLKQEAGGRPELKSKLELEVGGQKIISSGSASFSVQSGEEGKARIDLAKGDVEVTDVTGKPVLRPVPAAGSAVPRKAPGPPASLVAARPVSPSDDERLVNPDSVILKWSARDGLPASSTVEVARDPEFKVVVLRQEGVRAEALGEGSWVFHPDRKGRYYWRVAREDGGHRAVSEVASFEVLRRLRAPSLARPRVQFSPARARGTIDAPVLRRPVIRYRRDQSLWLRALGNAVAALDLLAGSEARAEDQAAQESQYTVDLEWERVPGAKAYTLQIASDEHFEHVSAEKVLTEPRFSWHTDSAGFYYWRVAGIDADGDRGPFSEFMTFTIKAERNRVGDETSYETYLEFDEYAKHQQSLALYYGPEWTNYYFSSTDPFSPDSVVYHKHTLINAALSYDYRLSPYYSLQFWMRTDKSVISAGDYENRPAQETLNQYETILAIGIERRIFRPSHYYLIQGGVRVSYIDMPTLGDGGNLVYDAFGYFGFYIAGGIHWSLHKDWDASVRLGGLYQYSGSSFRVAEYAIAEISHPILDWVFAGLSFDQMLSAFRFNSDVLVGQAHSLSFRPMLFIGFRF